MTYNEFISNIINTRGQGSEEVRRSGVCERHHIIPLCMGGAGRLSGGHQKNIIGLYAHEHYEAHKLLGLENKDNDSLFRAGHMMAFPKGDTNREYEISAEDYEILRAQTSKLSSNFMKANAKRLNKIRKIKLAERGNKLNMSDESRLRCSMPFKGKHYYNNGIEEKRFFDKDVPIGGVRGRLNIIRDEFGRFKKS